jgi:hypothetical protein
MQSWTATLDAFFASMSGATLDERICFCSSVANALTRLKACKHFASLTARIYKGILLLDMDGLHLMGRMSSKSFSSIIPEHDFVLCIAACVLPFIIVECAFETGLAGAAACSGAGFGGGAAAIACRGAMAGAGTCCGGAPSAGSKGQLIVPDKLLAAANCPNISKFGGVCGVKKCELSE